MSSKVDQTEINNILWQACDTFRGILNATDYKNYILIMLFVKYISDTWEEHYRTLEKEYGDDSERIKRRLERERFFLPDGCHFKDIFDQRNEPNIGEIINIALEKIEDANKAKLEGVFRNVDFNSEANLGKAKDRNSRLKSFLQDFNNPKLDLSPSRIGNLDVIGNAYEYLIGKFAAGAGQKAGEFYTPSEVSELLAELVAPKKGDRICDPTCGSGSLLVKCARQLTKDKIKDFALYGQEINGQTWALAKMNMFLHGVDSARIEWGDTIREPKLIKGKATMKFEVVVANPPFSLDKWGHEEAVNDPYNRFHRGLAPKTKGDYAFITHMIETVTEDSGRVGVVVPHGVLFRSSSEGKIRQKLIEENLLDAVIGLPSNLFYGAGIPAVILIFKKGKQDESVFFIDASRDYKDNKNQNKLREKDISKIVSAYQNRKSISKYASRIERSEIVENDFNLNIPRYVDSLEDEKEIDVKAVQKNIDKVEMELAAVRKEIKEVLVEFGYDT